MSNVVADDPIRNKPPVVKEEAPTSGSNSKDPFTVVASSSTVSENVQVNLADCPGDASTVRRTEVKAQQRRVTDDRNAEEWELTSPVSARRSGTNGFGYDPVFVPDHYKRSFAQMTQQEKNKISHRGIAIRKFADYLLT